MSLATSVHQCVPHRNASASLPSARRRSHLLVYCPCNCSPWPVKGDWHPDTRAEHTGNSEVRSRLEVRRGGSGRGRAQARPRFARHKGEGGQRRREVDEPNEARPRRARRAGT
eukprot:gene14676-biopygen5793